jgi:hypothetical protein
LILTLVVVGINKEQVTIEWTPGDNLVEWFEVRARWRDKAEAIYFSSFRVDMPTHSAVLPRPRSGNFAVEVRACRNWNDPPPVQCSDWITSNVHGKPEPWIIFWKPLMNSSFFIIEEEGEFDGLR